MTDDVPASQRWRGRPVHSLLVQAFIFAVPVVASVAAAAAVSAVGPRPRGTVELVAWWVVLTAIALAVLTLVDRLARRLLPLATLLKLSMLFPDRAPSRFRVARNAASVRKLSEQLAQARERGLTAEPVWAAETVLTLITALGHHDRRSRGHSERVHVYAELLADELDLPQADRDRLRWAALLHDVGKLIVPAEVLNKPADPDDGEWQALRRHPEAGAELCAPLLPWLGEWGAAIAQHHEWFDGTGYPRGLKGHEISRAARIVAVADCYEVMTTSRTYKRALSPAAAREELARCAGTQFDPAIVRAFLNVSLGRLRLAMGPLAVLATVPSMARLTSWLEPVARAGAVIGGAALIMGSSGVWQTPGAAEAASRPVAPATTPVVATVDVGVPPEKALPRPASASTTPRPRPTGAVPVADQPRGGTDTEAAPGDRRRATTQPPARPKATAPKPRPGQDSPRRTTTKPRPSARPPATQRPAPAKGGTNDGSTGRSDTPGGGANPTPPTSPPGLEPTKPTGPVASPKPPRSPKAKGRQF